MGGGWKDLVQVTGFVFGLLDGLSQLFDFLLVGDVFVGPQPVDESDAVDGLSEGAFCVEGGFDVGEEILLVCRGGGDACCGGVRGGGLEPGMLACLFCCESFGRVSGEELVDKVLGLVRNFAPVLRGFEAVVGVDDGLHLFHGGVAVERGIAAEEKVGDDANGPHVDGFTVAGLFKNLWRHIAGCTTGCGKDCDLFIVDDSGEAKVGNEQIAVFGLVSEEEVFGFEVAVDDALLMEVDNSLGDGSNNVCSVLFVVVAPLADAVKELATHTEIGDEVEVVHGFKVVDERDDRAVA